MTMPYGGFLFLIKKQGKLDRQKKKCRFIVAIFPFRSRVDGAFFEMIVKFRKKNKTQIPKKRTIKIPFKEVQIRNTNSPK